MQHLSQAQWWSYVQCQNFEGRGKIGTPETARKCAEAIGFDWAETGMEECAGSNADGKADEGISLLKESVLYSALLGIQ